MTEKASNNEMRKSKKLDEMIQKFKQNGRKPINIQRGEPFCYAVIEFANEGEHGVQVMEYGKCPAQTDINSSEKSFVIKATSNGLSNPNQETDRGGHAA